jgi:phosphatidylglycerol lysyltransferase
MASALAIAAWVAHRELRRVSPSQVLAALEATPASAIMLSVLFTALSYGCLATVEWKALKVIGRPQPFLRTLPASFTSNALSVVIGFGLVSGTAVRLRTYAFAGLRPAQVARLVLIFSAATFLSGVVAAGLSLVPRAVSGMSSSADGGMLAAAVLILVAPAALWLLLFRRRRAARRLTLGERAAAFSAGLGDWVFSGAALFILESRDLTAFPSFFSVFCLGSLMGSLAGVPGGIGVLEVTVLGLHAKTQVHQSAAALILYRAIYLAGPFLLALAGLAGAQLRRFAAARL